MIDKTLDIKVFGATLDWVRHLNPFVVYIIDKPIFASGGRTIYNKFDPHLIKN